MSPGNLSGSLIDQAGFLNSGMRDSGSEKDGLFSKFGTSPFGPVIDGIFEMSPSGMVLDGLFTDTICFKDLEAAVVPGTVVGPSGMVLDGISADTFDHQGL